MQFGRTKIYCDESNINEGNVVGILQDALLKHGENRNDCQTLYDYYKGNHPILNRTKTIREDICNKIIENRAYEFVEFKVGYLCGEPIQYVGRGSSDSITDGISKLNNMMLLCGKHAKDKEMVEWMYICGTGYRMVAPNSMYIQREIVPKLENRETDFSEDEAPFNLYTLDPRCTFVVYHSDVEAAPVMGVHYVTLSDNSMVYSVYTRDAYYEIKSNSMEGMPLHVESTVTTALQDIPIIEYALNSARLGIVEVVLTLIDAANTIQSNRIDGIEQFVQSLLILYNCEIDDDAAAALREAGLIKLKSFGDMKADVKELNSQLDQQQTQTLMNYIYQTMLNVVGMPNRNGGTSTSDTGSAVIMRDGWESAEARAKLDEAKIKESENKCLRLVLKIIRGTVGTALKLSDIEIKFTRRNYENILSKFQVLTGMLASDKIDPKLAFTHSGIFSDPEQAAKDSAAYYETVKAEQKAEQELAAQRAKANASTTTDSV